METFEGFDPAMTLSRDREYLRDGDPPHDASMGSEEAAVVPIAAGMVCMVILGSFSGMGHLRSHVSELDVEAPFNS